MEFLKESNDHKIVQEEFDAYQAYLKSIRDRLPDETFSFITAPWYYDAQSPQCPHDSWVEFLHISEVAEQDDIQVRHVDIHVRLLGAYHDGYIDLFYRRVRRYGFNAPAGIQAMTKFQLGHGDWLIDEVRLSGDGLVIHEIVFSNKYTWIIECESIGYQWTSTNKL